MTIVPAANQDNRQNQMIVRSRIMPDNLYAGGGPSLQTYIIPEYTVYAIPIPHNTNYVEKT